MRNLASRVALIGAVLLAIGASQPAQAQPWDPQLVEAAKKEGRVVIAGPPVPPHRQTILRFQEAFPGIAVEYSGEFPDRRDPKIMAERKAGRYLWDVVITGVSSLMYTRDIPAGYYDPVRPLILPENQKDESWIGGFEAGFLDKEKKYVFAFQATKALNVHVDRAQIPQGELKAPADLLKPQFKGRIAAYDPRQRGGASNAMAFLLYALGEDGYRKLYTDQKLIATGNQRQLEDWMARGTYPITVGVTPAVVEQRKADGMAQRVEALMLPSQYTQVTPSWGALLYFNRAPHPNASKLFVNWLLSSDAQKDWAERGKVNSRRADVPVVMPSIAVTAEEWSKGLNFNAESGLAVRSKAMAIADELLK